MAELKLKILKVTLMLRKLGNKYQSKDEQLAEFTGWFSVDRESDLDEWIEGLREELAKTPEQREEESRIRCEELAQAEAEEEYRQMLAQRHDRDEWDDYWADAARSVDAVTFI